MKKVTLSISFEMDEGDFCKLEEHGIDNFMNDIKEVIEGEIVFPNGIRIKCEEISDV